MKICSSCIWPPKIWREAQPSFHWLVAQTLARQFMKEVEATCSPSNLRCRQVQARTLSDTQRSASSDRR